MKKRHMPMPTPEADIVEAVIYSGPILSEDTVDDHYCIIDLEATYGPDERGEGRYWLTLGNCEYRSDDLGALEILLAEFMGTEGAEIPEDMKAIHGGEATLYETSGEAAAEADSAMMDSAMTYDRTHPGVVATRMELTYHADAGPDGRWTATISNRTGTRKEVI